MRYVLEVVDVLLGEGHLYSPVLIEIFQTLVRDLFLLVFFLLRDYGFLVGIFSFPQDRVVFSDKGLGRLVVGELKVVLVGFSH